MADDPIRRIELYRANIASPQTLEAMRFWVQNELTRIQSGFKSLDALLDPTGGSPGEPGAPGAEGPSGPAGAPGRGVAVFTQIEEPNADVSQPGDIWFVQELV